METEPACRETLLNEIIDNAAELPLESQNLLLMMAKAMAYTRRRLTAPGEGESAGDPAAKRNA